jgi:hypothetical protein
MAMRNLGYVEGKNLAIESRLADGKLERLSGCSIYAACRLAWYIGPVAATRHVPNSPDLEGGLSCLVSKHITRLATSRRESWRPFARPV